MYFQRRHQHTKPRELASECRKAQGERAGPGSMSTHSSVRLRENTGLVYWFISSAPQAHAVRPSVPALSVALQASLGSPALIFHHWISYLGLAVGRLGFCPLAFTPGLSCGPQPALRTSSLLRWVSDLVPAPMFKPRPAHCLRCPECGLGFARLCASSRGLPCPPLSSLPVLTPYPAIQNLIWLTSCGCFPSSVQFSRSVVSDSL